MVDGEANLQRNKGLNYLMNRFFILLNG